jgi:hypothetical protein
MTSSFFAFVMSACVLGWSERTKGQLSAKVNEGSLVDLK